MINLKQAFGIAVLSSTMIAQASAGNIVVNGSFELGNTGFISDYGLGDGSSNSLYDEGLYQIGLDPSSYHSDFVPITAQHRDNMMIVNGASQGNKLVWSQSGLTVAANTTYYFSTWVASVTGESPAKLAFSINGSKIGELQATNSSNWQQFYTSWNSGAATFADIALVNLNTATGGNDFALDNIAFDTMVPAGAVPEPASITLLGFGLAGAFVASRRKKQG